MNQTALEVDEHEVICRCSGVSKQQILKLLQQGETDVERISRITGVLSGCGGCETDVMAVVDEAKQTLKNPTP